MALTIAEILRSVNPNIGLVVNPDGSYRIGVEDVNSDEVMAAVQAMVTVETPVAKAAVFNTALPAAEAGWLGATIAPTKSPSYINIYVCVSILGILRVARTVGGVTVTENLNAGVNLVAGAAYMFTVPWRTGDSINIRYSTTTGTITRLIIDEIGG